jgi:hypothetical protein
MAGEMRMREYLEDFHPLIATNSFQRKTSNLGFTFFAHPSMPTKALLLVFLIGLPLLASAQSYKKSIREFQKGTG